MSERGDQHKLDGGKLMYDLLPPEFEESVVRVLTYGANKYEPNGWRNVPDAINRYYAALRRHLTEYRKGNVTDDESGLKHLEHAACNICFLLELSKESE